MSPIVGMFANLCAYWCTFPHHTYGAECICSELKLTWFAYRGGASMNKEKPKKMEGEAVAAGCQNTPRKNNFTFGWGIHIVCLTGRPRNLIFASYDLSDFN